MHCWKDFWRIVLVVCTVLAGVMASPGVGYGEYGEGYIRFSLTTGQKCFDEFDIRLKEKWNIENKKFI